VTSVGGTGTVNGITLTGTVTSSGNLTLGGTLGSIANSQLTNSSVTIGTTAVALGAAATSFSGLTALNFASGTNGITFNNTSALNNSTLNDYETGTWTPLANSASGSITAYTSFGTYTKVGRTVLLQGNITITTPGTAAGQLQLTGLPFTSINSGTAGLTQFTGVCRETANTGVIYYILVNINNTSAAIQNSTNGGVIYLATYYYTFSVVYAANF
jgi:hypothetical protein